MVASLGFDLARYDCLDHAFGNIPADLPADRAELSQGFVALALFLQAGAQPGSQQHRIEGFG
jgi:hypothetical protein